VILIDSFSHEHAGEGGLLDWHEEEFQRMGGRDAVKMTAWIKPKMSHKAMVNRLLQVNAHLLLCFRAEEKVDIVKNAQGKTEIVPKKTLTGLNGWVPISEKTLPYELTASFLLTADAPGVPKPIKLQSQHRPFFPLDKPISEDAGRRLAEWAQGGLGESGAHEASPSAAAEASPPSSDSPSPLDLLIATYGRDEVVGAYKELFPNRDGSPLAEEEIEVLADRLRTPTLEGAQA